MMRSMYSAVSGLKTHQTKMDVIGNNIANVNTVAFKSSSVTFRDILYQTTSSASGANANTGAGGINAKQIGLGVSMAATNISITSAGASETTGNPFDIKLTDKNSTNFFIVSDGTQNLFTRSGSFYVDGAGNLCMTSTGYTVMGWQVDETTGAIRKDTVSALRIMQEKNLTSPPEATINAVMGGVLDSNDTDVKSEAGKVLNLNFFDDLGYAYTAKFAVRDTDEKGVYTVGLTSILDSNNKNLLEGMTAEQISKLFGSADETTEEVYKIDPVAYGSTINANDPNNIIVANGNGTFTYNVANGTFNNGATLTDVFGDSSTMVALQEMLEQENSPYSLVYNQETVTFSVNKQTVALTTSAAKVFSSDDLQAGYTLSETTPGTIVGEDGSEYVFNSVTGMFEGTDKDGNYSTKTAIEIFKISDTLQTYLGFKGTDANPDYSFVFNEKDGAFEVIQRSATYDLVFDTGEGLFRSINGDPSSAVLKIGDSTGEGGVNQYGNFKNISIDFTQCLNYNNGGKSTLSMDSGAVDGTTGKGRKLGNMIGISIDSNGKIFGSYSNGNTELLGQIAVAQFANASGLSKMGENCYQTTLNSGDFDGIGVEVNADGSTMTSGELEMSNVDLSTEFTQMITTQRGFQANSRVITTSDTLLEELVNLKR